MRRLSCLVLLLALPFAAAAQEHDHSSMTGGEHAGHTMPAPSKANVDSASTRASLEAMQKMHEGMDIKYTGDADRDFAAGMIPHHQGAVEMAEIQLKYGKDPSLKRLAKSIIAAQRKEIRYMQKWHDEHTQKGK